MARLLYGLDRLPRGVALDDPRLPGIALGPAPLRLNSIPVPPAVMAGAGDGHAARLGACRAWLHAQCGDYALKRRRFVDAYLAFAADMLELHRAALTAGLARYEGVYDVADWTWSALRPLPRAWLAVGEGAVAVEMAFWDGARVFAACVGAPPAGLREAGIEVLALDGADLATALPAAFHRFWDGETLPRSPFRRPAL